MTIAHRFLDQMHVQATGCRDRHQGIAATEAHRDRLEHLAGLDAQRPRLIDRGSGLLVRDGLEPDAVGLPMAGCWPAGSGRRPRGRGGAPRTLPPRRPGGIEGAYRRYGKAGATLAGSV